MICKKINLDEKCDSIYLEALIADKINGCQRDAILVIPGGGYHRVCSDREGEPIAQSFMPYGFNAFILHYSVATVNDNTFPTQLIEASKAIKHIKDNAEEYGINPERIFVVGFSAGGHLAASIGNMWSLSEIYDAVDMPYGYNKPTGVMLIYPVISGVSEFAHKGSFINLLASENPDKSDLEKCSIELNVSADSSPAYLVHAANDYGVPAENSLLLAMEYSKHKIPYELHIYPRGEHGFALANEITWCNYQEHVNRANEKWVQNAVEWSKTI